jgi:hypothetical protein
LPLIEPTFRVTGNRGQKLNPRREPRVRNEVGNIFVGESEKILSRFGDLRISVHRELGVKRSCFRNFGVPHEVQESLTSYNKQAECQIGRGVLLRASLTR